MSYLARYKLLYKTKSTIANTATKYEMLELKMIIWFMVKIYRPNDYGLTIEGSIGDSPSLISILLSRVVQI